MFIIATVLTIIALYCGGAWLWLSHLAFKHRGTYVDADLVEIERQTFHLGLCLILSIGFLGLIWK